VVLQHTREIPLPACVVVPGWGWHLAELQAIRYTCSLLLGVFAAFWFFHLRQLIETHTDTCTTCPLSSIAAVAFLQQLHQAGSQAGVSCVVYVT